MRTVADKRSFALAITLPILCLIIFICTTLLVMCTNDLLLAYRECNYMRAYCIADAGIVDGYARLRAAGDPPSIPPPFTQNYPVGGVMGSYNVKVALKIFEIWPVYTITSIGTYRGVSKTLQMTVQETSFSHWAYITNTELVGHYLVNGQESPWYGAQSYWVTGNIVDGPLQVNDYFFIAGNPIFNGPASAACAQITYYDAAGVDNPQFNGGLWLSAPAVILPDPDPLLNHISDTAKLSGGLYLDSTDHSVQGQPKPGVYRGPNGVHTDTSIVFLANGTMNVTNANRGWVNQNMPIPANGAIYVTGGEVDVKGVLNGQVTIGCDQDIYTADNITYHDTSPGNPNPASTDVLGLVARTNVVFPNTLADGDKEIDAYIVALKGSFYLEDMGSVPNVKGKLTQYGGTMAQWSATVFGCFSGNGTLQFGYLQIPYYDDRLISLTPPCFTPATDFNGVKYRRMSLQEL